MCYNFCVQLVGQLNARKIGLTLAAYRCSASVSVGARVAIGIDIGINIGIGLRQQLISLCCCRSAANQGKMTSSQLHN